MKEIFYDWGGANVWMFHAINNIRAGWLDQFMLLGTWLGGHAMFPFYLGLLTLLAFSVLNTQTQNDAQYPVLVKRWLTVIAVFSLAYWLDGLLLGYLKPLLDFPRPPLALQPETMHVIGKAEYHHSLPSGHSTFAIMVVTSLWPVLSGRGRAVGVFFVLWVGVSRISLGMHFPADVVAGYLLGLFVVLLLNVALQQLQRFRGK
jgi:membrane-associated phospholipid phosphatase